jgi:hypothetical protein
MSLQEAGPIETTDRAETAARRKRMGLATQRPGHRYKLPAVDAKPNPITLRRIVAMVSAEFGVSVMHIRGSSRAEVYVAPRRAIAYLGRKLTIHSFRRIGLAIGRRDHSTMMTAERRAKERMKADHEFAFSVSAVERRLVESAARYVMADLIEIDGQPCDYIECPHCQRVVFEAKRGAA